MRLFVHICKAVLRRTAQRKGFNLIEMAIVMGVVGIVLGGAWIAAAKVMENQKVNTLATGIVRIVSGVRQMFPIYTYPTAPNSGLSILKPVINAGIVGRDLPISDDLIYTPWNGKLGVTLGNYGEPRIHIVLYGNNNDPVNGITQEQCNMLVPRLMSIAGTSQGLERIFIDPGIVYHPPYNPAAVSCPASINNVQFQYAPQ